MAQKTGPQIHAHDLVPGNRAMIKIKEKPFFEGFVFKIVAIKAKQTTNKADDQEITSKIIKMPNGDNKIKKGTASKLGIPDYIYGSEASFFQAIHLVKLKYL